MKKGPLAGVVATVLFTVFSCGEKKTGIESIDFTDLKQVTDTVVEAVVNGELIDFTMVPTDVRAPKDATFSALKVFNGRKLMEMEDGVSIRVKLAK